MIDYKCSACGVGYVKLWRQWNTFMCHIKLLCIDCAGKDQHTDVSETTEDGQTLWNISGCTGTHDTIGGLCPAVPVAGEDTFWGYSSVPEEDCKWWYDLPLRSKK